MDWKHARKVMFRGSVVVVFFFGLFWLAWYLVAGNIPVITSIQIGRITLELPFGISRGWDILISLIWPIILTIVFESEYIHEYRFTPDPETYTGITIGNLAAGFMVGLLLNALGSPEGWISSLITVGFILLVLSMCNEAFTSRSNRGYKKLITDVPGSLFFSSMVALGVGVGLVFTTGLGIGLVIGLVVGVILFLIQYTLTKIVRFIYYWIKFAVQS